MKLFLPSLIGSGNILTTSPQTLSVSSKSGQQKLLLLCLYLQKINVWMVLMFPPWSSVCKQLYEVQEAEFSDQSKFLIESNYWITQVNRQLVRNSFLWTNLSWSSHNKKLSSGLSELSEKSLVAFCIVLIINSLIFATAKEPNKWQLQRDESLSTTPILLLISLRTRDYTSLARDSSSFIGVIFKIWQWIRIRGISNTYHLKFSSCNFRSVTELVKPQ